MTGPVHIPALLFWPALVLILVVAWFIYRLRREGRLLGWLGRAQQEQARRDQAEVDYWRQCVAPTGAHAVPRGEAAYQYVELSVIKQQLGATLNNWGRAGWLSKVIAQDTGLGGHPTGTVFLVLERRIAMAPHRQEPVNGPA